MTTFYIDPSQSTNGSGTFGSPYNSWASVTFTAGNTYLQKCGTVYTGNIVISTVATAANPILLGNYHSGALPNIQGWFNLSGCAYITIVGFLVGPSPGNALFNLNSGATHIDIAGNTMINGEIGVYTDSTSGTNSVIQNNLIQGMENFGIDCSGIYTGLYPSGNGILILNNNVSNSVSHGIELESNYATATGNISTFNGLQFGASGIHVFSVSAQTYGQHNLVQYNICANNLCYTSVDGNGIEFDQYCDHNTATGNLCFNNAAPGITLFDAANNTVSSNFTIGNTLDPGNTHGTNVQGEILILNSLNRDAGNTVSSNVFISNRSAVPCINVDPGSVTQGQTFTGNADFNLISGGNLIYWSGTYGTTLANLQSHCPTDTTTIPLLHTASYFGPVTYRFPTPFNATVNGNNVTFIGWCSGYPTGSAGFLVAP